MLKTYDKVELTHTRRYYTTVHFNSDNVLHTHNFWELVYQIKGETKNLVNGHPYTLQPGDALLMKPGDTHQIIFDDKAQTRDIYIQDEQFQKIAKQFNYDFSSCFNGGKPLSFSINSTMMATLEDSLLIFSLFQEQSSTLDDIHGSIVTFILSHYITETLGSHKAISSWLKDLIRDLTSEEFLAMPISEIIKTTNYSYGHVAREFKKYSNLTLKEYIMLIKMEQASALLLHTTDSVETIAYKTGFQSATGFIKAFSRIYKTTPHKYRQKFSRRRKG